MDVNFVHLFVRTWAELWNGGRGRRPISRVTLEEEEGAYYPPGRVASIQPEPARAVERIRERGAKNTKCSKFALDKRPFLSQVDSSFTLIVPKGGLFYDRSWFFF